MIDSHMHVNKILIEDEEKEISDINKNNNVEKVINVGLNIPCSTEINKISMDNSKFYNSIGIHPLYIEGQDFNKLYNLVTDKVVAVGEIGLDSLNSNFEDQIMYLKRQIYIANELQLPVIIHANNTNKEVINIFKNYIKPLYGCVFHCFQPDFEALKYLIENDMYISFAGRITYKTARKSIEIAKDVPNNRFLIETDSPYIAPEPLRGQTNRVENLKYILKKLSEIKQLSENEIEEITTENTKKLFKKL